MVISVQPGIQTHGCVGFKVWTPACTRMTTEWKRWAVAAIGPPRSNRSRESCACAPPLPVPAPADLHMNDLGYRCLAHAIAEAIAWAVGAKLQSSFRQNRAAAVIPSDRADEARALVSAPLRSSQKLTGQESRAPFAFPYDPDRSYHGATIIVRSGRRLANGRPKKGEPADPQKEGPILTAIRAMNSVCHVFCWSG